MKASELNIDNLKSKAYFVEGEDGYWQDYSERFFTELVPPEHRDFNLKIFTKLSGFTEIQEALTTFSMFSGNIVVIVKDEGYKTNDGDAKIFNFLIDNLGENYLVFMCTNFLTPQMKKKMQAINASKLDTFELRKIIRPAFEENGITSGAINLLIEYTGRNMARISNEIQKIKAYAGERLVKEEDIQALVFNDVENEIYEFTGAIAAKNHLLAMDILGRFLDRGVSHSFLISALISQYRRMLHSALSNKSEKEVGDYLRVKPYAIKKSREVAGKYTKVRLKICLDTLIQSEFDFKSGVMGEETALKKAITQLILA